MLELNVQFVNDTVNANSTRYQAHMEAGRGIWQEVVLIEPANLGDIVAASHGWSEVDKGLGFGCVCVHDLLDVFGMELI